MESLSCVVSDTLFFVSCSTASVNLAKVSLSDRAAMAMCSSAPTISFIVLAKWKPASPVVTLVSSTRSGYSSAHIVLKLSHVLSEIAFLRYYLNAME